MGHSESEPLTKENLVVLITGCSTGLGYALAESFSKGQGMKTSLEPLSAFGVICLPLDVTDEDSVRSCFKEIEARVGRISVVINNAGISRFGPVAEQPLAEFQEVLNANLFGVVRVIQYSIPLMTDRGGLIINVGSVTSELTTPFSAAYSSSKAALLAVTNAMRMELQPFKTCVTYAMAGSIKSNVGVNSAGGSRFDIYSSSGSLYNKWSTSISERAVLSQGKYSMSPTKVSNSFLRVIRRPECYGSWVCCKRFSAGQQTPCSPGLTSSAVIDVAINNAAEKLFGLLEISGGAETSAEDKDLIGKPLLKRDKSCKRGFEALPSSIWQAQMNH
eukprot:jgi/Picsp_1/6542/NSC_03885-R1_uncharacterized oxidoreductase -like